MDGGHTDSAESLVKMLGVMGPDNSATAFATEEMGMKTVWGGSMADFALMIVFAIACIDMFFGSAFDAASWTDFAKAFALGPLGATGKPAMTAAETARVASSLV